MEPSLAAPSREAWRLWIERVLLFLGAAQIIAGIFFFFAYNWDDLSRWQKLGVTQTLIVLAALGARFAGLDSLIGRVLLLSAGAFVGVAFAVYGQIYQTGADAFDLFANWAAVILGWVLIARFAAYWILWAVIVNTALALYLDTFTAFGDTEWAMALGLLNAAFLIAHEAARPYCAWLSHPWSRRAVMAACLVFFTMAAIAFLSDLFFYTVAFRGWPDLKEAPLYFTALPSFLLAAGLCYLWSRGPARDLIGLFLVVLAVCAVAWSIGFLAIDEALYMSGSGLLTLAVITLAIFGLAGWWLHRVWLLLGRAAGAGAAESDV